MFIIAVIAAIVHAPPTMRSETPVPKELLTIEEVLAGADTTGFARADAPRRFVFPDDHGPHPDFRTEWWYYTGNVVSASGRRFGFQLTFFRSALAPSNADGSPRRDPAAQGDRFSRWRTNQVYMAHFAVTDAEGGRFFAFERFSRAANDLAGATTHPLRVWVDDWSAQFRDAGSVHLRAAERHAAIELTLTSRKSPVLQGDAGWSRKGREPGNASYYYSLTRMEVSGTVRAEGHEEPVSGAAWMDREWSTSALEPGQVGWDWFSLQLDDNTEWMFYRIRRDDGSTDPSSLGSFVNVTGEKDNVTPAVTTIEVLDHWKSPSGVTYPSRWHIRAGELNVVVEPLVADQELRHAFQYWEGAVRVSGSRAGLAVEGQGYVELTGYTRAR